MAKASKLEDYWRQNNIEVLLKDITQVLTRRMPLDPAAAIVEHLQKKFPKSFKSSMPSPASDSRNESMREESSGRRFSAQSQVSGSIAIPSVGSAFTDLLKQTVVTAQQAAPDVELKDVILLNRLGQQVVKMGKDIRSERDILEEELLKPLKTKVESSSAGTSTAYPGLDDLSNGPVAEQTCVKQLIKYKQQIRDENDRRLHREKLAEIAQCQREKEILAINTSTIDGQQQKHVSYGDNRLLEDVSSTAGSDKTPAKSVAKSREEEDILNDENIFQPKKIRYRTRQKDRSNTLSNAANIRGFSTINFQSLRNDQGTLVCKKCGTPFVEENNQRMEQGPERSNVCGTLLQAPSQPFRSIDEKDDALNDFFESESSMSESRDLSISQGDENLLSKLGAATFRRDVFRPITSDNNGTIGDLSLTRPLVPPDDERESKRLKTPRLSQSDIFVRSPDPPRYSSPTLFQGRRSPGTRKQQTPDNSSVNPQSARSMTPMSSGRAISPIGLPPKIVMTKERRPSNWSVRENSPVESEDN